KRLQNLVADDPIQTKNLQDLQTHIATWRQFAADALAQKTSSNTSVDSAAQLTGKQEMDSIRDQLAAFVDTQDQSRSEAIRVTRTTIQFVILIVIIGGLTVGGLVALATVRQLIRLSRSYEQTLNLLQQRADELSSQREWLRGVLSSMGDAVIATDTQKNVTFINPITAKLTGWSAEEAAGKPITAVYNIVIESAVQSDTSSGTKKLISRDGKSIFIEDKIALIKDADGEQMGTVVVFRDITNRKLVEQERLGLIEAQTHYANQLRQSNEQLQQFAYVASHDLQEPLRMVISYLQLLEKRYAAALGTEASEFIAFAVDGANRMRELITGLLQYARLDTNEQDMHQLSSLQDALDKALTNLSMPIAESGATITHDPLPQIQADPMQMMQLLQNLIGNALKFRGEQPLKIHIGAEQKTDEWEFCVRDNGIGIASEYQKRIFGMFQRLHINTAYSGTGIGLTICKKVVERHNGRIWVESAVGEGATFYFALPIHTGDQLPTFSNTSRPHSY
ncbi:MAG: ATP-binding protein, partial [Chloroflexota bacterium]